MAKLTLQPLNHNKEPHGETFEVNYNPPELSFTKTATYADINIPGLDAPLLQFVRGSTETLNLELFFDSTENGTAAAAIPVSSQVDKFYQLVKISGTLHTPPLVRIFWGEHFPGLRNDQSQRAVPAFDCIVTSCTRKFTLFNPDGMPLRAIVTLAVREYRTLEEQLQALNLQSSDHTRVHVVQQGENLPLIAYMAYGNAARWQLIAEANQLTNARSPAPGTVLTLPPTV